MATPSRSKAILAVIEFADGWRILPGGSNLKPYASQADAISVARHLIALAELSGREVQLLVHDTFGELRAAVPSSAPQWVSLEPRRGLNPELLDQHPPRPAREGSGTGRGAAVHEAPTRFFPANLSDADLPEEMGSYPALLVMRLRSQSPWWASRPETTDDQDPAPGRLP